MAWACAHPHGPAHRSPGFPPILDAPLTGSLHASCSLCLASSPHLLKDPLLALLDDTIRPSMCIHVYLITYLLPVSP